MAHRLDGKKLAKEIELRLQHEINLALPRAGRPPGLAVLRVGDDPASGVYVANKEKACTRTGIKSYVTHLDQGTSSVEIKKTINELNQDINVDGILLQLPLPKGLNESAFLETIDPSKDADGLHTLNLGRLIKGEKGSRSCTPAGVMALLKRNEIQIEGKRAVVIGRSILVGKPMALMLQDANATVSVAHSKTQNLAELTKQADLLVVAAGRPQFIGSEHIKKDSVVIDVGIHRFLKESEHEKTNKYLLCGDVRFDEVASKVSAITPVPGGVGPMTVSMLLVNTVMSWQKHFGFSVTINDLLP